MIYKLRLLHCDNHHNEFILLLLYFTADLMFIFFWIASVYRPNYLSKSVTNNKFIAPLSALTATI